MPGTLIIAESGLACYTCLILLEFAAVICENLVPPNELTSLYRRSDNMNFPINLKKTENENLCEYILADEHDLAVLSSDKDEAYCGLTKEGIIVFVDLKPSLERKHLGNVKQLQVLFKPVVEPRIHDLATSPKAEYLLQVLEIKNFEVMHTFIITAEINAETKPIYKLQLDTNYNSLLLLYRYLNLRFAMKRTDTLEYVTIVNDNGKGEITFEKTLQFNLGQFYEWNSENGVMRMENYSADEIAPEKKSFTLAKNLLPPKLPQYLVNAEQVLVGEFTVQTDESGFTLLNAGNGIPNFSEDTVFLNVFSESKFKLVSKVAGTREPFEDGPRHIYKFTVKTNVDPNPSPAFIVNSYIETNFLFTLSHSFEKCKYDPLDKVEIFHLGDNGFSVEHTAFIPEETHQCGLDGELILARVPIFAVKEASSTAYKIQGILAKKDNYYLSLFRFKDLTGKTIHVKFSKLDKVSDGRGQVYFTETSLHKNYNLPELSEDEMVLYVFDGHSLQWRVVVQLDQYDTLKKNEEFEIVARNAPNDVLSYAIANYPETFTFILWKHDPKTQQNNVCQIVVNKHVAATIYFTVNQEALLPNQLVNINNEPAFSSETSSCAASYAVPVNDSNSSSV